MVFTHVSTVAQSIAPDGACGWFILSITTEPLRYHGSPGQATLLPCKGQQTVERGREEGQGPGRAEEPCNACPRTGGESGLPTFSPGLHVVSCLFSLHIPALLTQRLEPIGQIQAFTRQSQASVPHSDLRFIGFSHCGCSLPPPDEKHLHTAPLSHPRLSRALPHTDCRPQSSETNPESNSRSSPPTFLRRPSASCHQELDLKPGTLPQELTSS